MVKTMPERCPGNKEEGARLCLRGRTFSRKLPHDIQQVAFRKLRILNRTIRLKDLAIPLPIVLRCLAVIVRANTAAVSIDQWRICFKWQEDDAFDV